MNFTKSFFFKSHHMFCLPYICEDVNAFLQHFFWNKWHSAERYALLRFFLTIHGNLK